MKVLILVSLLLSFVFGCNGQEELQNEGLFSLGARSTFSFF